MKRLLRLLPTLLLAAALAGCGNDATNPMSPSTADADGDGVSDADDAFPDDPAESADTDRDGLGDNTDPTPGGTTANRLNGQFTGGRARAVAITWYAANGAADSSNVYDGALDTDCSNNWGPQGTLCDEPPTIDDPFVSTKTGPSGGTWREATGGTGVLVVDACADGSLDAVDFNEARVFQMYSDGKTTHVRISVHPSRSATPPGWNDAGWQPLGVFVEVGEGQRAPGADVVSMPTVIPLPPSITRYVRIEARNDGRHGSGSYIELRCVKLFSVPRS